MNKQITKVYGPYTRKDLRKHVVIVYSDGTRRTQSYPRRIMEEVLGRELEDWEQVDHINDDPTDNRISNLQLLTSKENNRKSAKDIEMYLFNCPYCGAPSQIPMRRYRHNQVKQGKSGPFCSRFCAAKGST